MHWNAFFVVILVVAFGVFAAMPFLFDYLVNACVTSSSFSNTSSTEFSCAVGWVGVASSLVSFGSFALPMKSPPVQQADVGPMGFQLYMSLAISCSSFIVLVRTPFSFTYWGIVSAALWVPTSLLSQVAVRFVGIGIGQAMWAGVTVIVSFVWGVAYFGEKPSSLGGALGGLLLILVGIVGLSACNSGPLLRLQERISSSSSGKKKSSSSQGPQQSLLAVQSGDSDDDTVENSKKINSSSSSSQEQQQQQQQGGGLRSLLFGTLAAVGTGMFNGSMLVPATLAGAASDEFKGTGFIVSFGIGVAAVTLFVAPFYYLIFDRRCPRLYPRQMALPALSTGIMWSIGNFGSIFASQYLGLAVGFSLTQCALLIAGIWGLTLLREVKGLIPIVVFFLGAFILLGGSVMLAVFGRS